MYSITFTYYFWFIHFWNKFIQIDSNLAREILELKSIPSYKEYDNRVLGVVKEDSDKPIVLGAEPVLITGVISEGDFIVTSDKKGHGKKGLSNNMFGKVIGQALEDGDGDSYTIRAMIRKL